MELLEHAQSTGTSAAVRAADLAHTNERLGSVTENALKQANAAREGRAHAGLQLALMADRRDELIEQIDKLKAEADAIGKSSYAFAFYMDRQKAERERGVSIACTAKELFTEKLHYKNFLLDREKSERLRKQSNSISKIAGQI